MNFAVAEYEEISVALADETIVTLRKLVREFPLIRARRHRSASRRSKCLIKATRGIRARSLRNRPLLLLAKRWQDYCFRE
jgi:hypothetical protein